MRGFAPPHGRGRPRLHDFCRDWVAGFVGRDFWFVFQGQADVVEAFQQAVAGEFVDLEGGFEASVIRDLVFFEVNG